MKAYFVTYSDEKFDKHRKTLNEQAKLTFDGVFTYDRNWLINTDFYEPNKEILDQSTGAGFCLWKPYIILETLKSLEPNDILFYLDSADIFTNNLVEFLKDYFNSDYEFILTYGGFNKQKTYTRRDCFVLMDCDNEKYHEHIQLEAGMIALKKTNHVIEILEEWLHFCKNKHILTNIENICGDNLTGFIAHRYDQSVLTNLAVKHNLNINRLLRNFITCNVN